MGRLRAEHRREHREHVDWRSDLDRWRDEYLEAVLEYVRRAAPQLETEGYEAALDAHEIAIDAHEEMIRRHERMLTAEAQGGPVTSGDLAGVQATIHERHRRSREEHRLIEATHRAVLKGLRMLAPKDPSHR